MLGFAYPTDEYVLTTVAGALRIGYPASGTIADPAQNIIGDPMDQAEHDMHHGGHQHHIDGHVGDEAHYARHAVGLDP
ncbi:hypothetical protein D3C76_978300 [compost metagenome]